MSPSRTILSLLASSLALTHASPHSLDPRGSNGPPDGDITYTSFAPNWPTCGNDHSLTDLGLKTTITVAVRPDCDTVIDTICNVAVAQNTRNNANLFPKYLYNIGYTSGTCEGHILFGYTYLADPFSKADCVSSFQGISEMCMLLDAPKQWDRYGKIGSQFGVRNIRHNPDGGAVTFPVWQARSELKQYTGYMLGATGVWGQVTGKDASDFNADGSLKEGRW